MRKMLNLLSGFQNNEGLRTPFVMGIGTGSEFGLMFMSESSFTFLLFSLDLLETRKEKG
jgi:hypothetical protein